jgi:hypothetical protein
MGPTLRPSFALSRRRGLEIVLCMQSPWIFARVSMTMDPAARTRVIKIGRFFSKIVEKWQNRIGLNLKTAENTVHCFKILEKDKNQ